MKNRITLSLLSALLLLSFNHAWAQSVELNLQYILPSHPELQRDARQLEASAISRRNIEIQICSNGNNIPVCEKNAEIAFRLRILAIPKARIVLRYNFRGETNTYEVLDLTAYEAVDPYINYQFPHLNPYYSYFTGVRVRIDDCSFSPRNYNQEFSAMVCDLIRRGENASLSLWKEVHRSKENGTAPSLSRASFLFDHGADVNFMNLAQVTVLGIAASYGFADMSKFLIDRGADLDAKDQSGYSPLMKAALKGHVAVMKLLINQGADIHARDLLGSTALGFAAIGGALPAVQYLVENGADVNASQTQMGRTALELALDNGHTDIAEYLRRNGATE